MVRSKLREHIQFGGDGFQAAKRPGEKKKKLACLSGNLLEKGSLFRRPLLLFGKNVA